MFNSHAEVTFLIEQTEGQVMITIDKAGIHNPIGEVPRRFIHFCLRMYNPLAACIARNV